jgi:predicted  nucleic acid-binding Zn-ribbon protein
MRRLAEEIAQLQRVNQQQALLIHVLCDAYNSPQNRGPLYTVLENHCRIQSRLSKGKSGRTSQLGSENCIARIRELELEIAEQDRAYEDMENRLKAYNEAARQYEDELARIGEGNAQILASFQRNANASSGNSFSSTASIDGANLSARAQELLTECTKIKRLNDDSKKLHGEIQGQLSKSQEECVTLERRISRTRKKLNDSINASTDDAGLQSQIEEQEVIISSLNQEIDQASATIAQLKRENQSLRDRLQSPD